VPSFSLDIIQTLALGAAFFSAGVFVRKRVPLLARLNIPSAVVGGLLAAGLLFLARDRWFNVRLDTTAQPLFMVAFFTTIGMQASLRLLRSGGTQVLTFLVMASVFCFVQNFVGMGIARLFESPPLLGVIAGSVTLVGGPATGLAFAPLFEQAGVSGAGTIAIASATFGIICGGIIGGPVGTWLIRRRRLVPWSVEAPGSAGSWQVPSDAETLPVEIDREFSTLVHTLVMLGVTMGLGSLVSGYFQSLGWTLPAYIGAMLVAAILRNIDDTAGWLRINHRAMDLVGGISLNIFLVVALMDLKTWELLSLALPLVTILAAQVLAVTLFAATVGFRAMGRDYDSAVMAGGFIGFVLGTAANAVANMRTLTAAFGPSPKAFIVVPLVGAFFIDFVNAVIIVWFLNWLT
jgi:ESS family glutamate:Na+ symporter